jgi:hypothetical protein
MSTKSAHTVSYTVEELRAMRDRGETSTDWIAAGLRPVPDGSDPDDEIEAGPSGSKPNQVAESAKPNPRTRRA